MVPAPLLLLLSELVGLSDLISAPVFILHRTSVLSENGLMRLHQRGHEGHSSETHDILYWADSLAPD